MSSTPLKPGSQVFVLGGGVVGLSCARELARRDYQVSVLDPRHVGGGASAASVGVLSAPTAKRSPWGQLCRRGYEDFPRLADELGQETGIDVEYEERGCLHLFDTLPRNPHRASRPWREAGAETRWLPRAEICEWIPQYGGRYEAALRLEREATVNPSRLIEALASACRSSGVQLFESLSDAPRLVPHGEFVEIHFGGRTVRGHAAVLATGAWTNRADSDLPNCSLDVRPVRGQALEVQYLAPRCAVHFHAGPEGATYHLVPRSSDLLWVGSTVEEVGFSEDVTSAGRAELLSRAQEVQPGIAPNDVVGQWCGLRPKAMRRGGPYLLAWPGTSCVWVASGHYRSGILTGPATATMLAEHLARGTVLEPRFGLPAE